MTHINNIFAINTIATENLSANVIIIDVTGV